MKLLYYLVISICMQVITTQAHKNVCSTKCHNAHIRQGSIASFYHTTYPFSLPALPYAADALEPYIDKETMIIHHGKHHQTYINNLNEILKDQPHLQHKTLAELLTDKTLPDELYDKIHNQGGGHFNHSLFWTIMKPKAPMQPTGILAEHITKDFGSFATFQAQFNAAAKKVFGSGWAWLVTNQYGKLKIITTHNQDTPLSNHSIPILGLDVWEHAYYLKYQNKRIDYIAAFWHVINWDQVQQYYERAIHKQKC